MTKPLKKPDWLNDKLIKQKLGWSSEMSWNAIGNNGEDVVFYAEYLGYFETLKSAHIIMPAKENLNGFVL